MNKMYSNITTKTSSKSSMADKFSKSENNKMKREKTLLQKIVNKTTFSMVTMLIATTNNWIRYFRIKVFTSILNY